MGWRTTVPRRRSSRRLRPLRCFWVFVWFAARRWCWRRTMSRAIRSRAFSRFKILRNRRTICCCKLARYGANLCFFYCGGDFKILCRQVFIDCIHHLFPYRHTRMIRQKLERFRLVVAIPHNADIIGRKARKPTVILVVGRTGFAAGRHIYAKLCRSTGSVLDNALQHRVYKKRS